MYKINHTNNYIMINIIYVYILASISYYVLVYWFVLDVLFRFAITVDADYYLVLI